MYLQVLLAQGFGDDEDAFEVVGVYSNAEEVARKKAEIIGEQQDFDPVFRVDGYELDE